MDPALRIVALGCGRVLARYHLPAIRAVSDVVLAGACETDGERRAWAAQALGGVPCRESLDALLDEAAADAALIATPPGSHAALTRACLARGLAVLVEKPLATTETEALGVLDQQRLSGRVVRVGFNRRFRASYGRLREWVLARGGATEIVFTFVADAARWNPAAGRAASTEEVLHDAGSHAVDLLAFVAGRRLVGVRAAASRDGESSCRVEIEARLEGGGTGRCTVGHGPAYDERLIVRAGGGWRRAETSGRGGWSRLAAIAALAGRKLARSPTPTDATFRAQLAAFARACRGRPEPIGADARAGVAAAAAVTACVESLARGGTWCEIPGRDG